jgi:hypothetical protein
MEDKQKSTHSSFGISHALVCHSFKNGTPMTVLAKEHGCSRQRIQQILKKAGLTRKDGGACLRKTNDMADRREYVESYFNGKTLKELEHESGLSIAQLRTSVQWFKKSNNNTHNNGRPAWSPFMCERHCQKIWSCSFEEWNRLRGMHAEYAKSPIGRYSQFRNNMRRLYPDQVWNLSLMEWWNLWQESGHYTIIGTTKNSYCLTRKDQEVGFILENMMVVQVHTLFSVKARRRSGPRKVQA